jgi:LPXTG-motif cell wall-anchored protein
LRNSGTTGVYKDGILTWQNFTQPLSELTYSWSTNYSNTTIEFSGTVTQPLHENLTKVDVHDSTIYVGDNWKAEDNFDSALDKDGNTVDFTKVTVDDSKVDTSKAGTYDVTYTYDGVTSTAKVTVKAKQTAVNVHDSTIYVGDNWKAEDNFDSALDKDGNTVAFTKVTVDDSKVDTSKAGTYDVTYTYDGVTSTAKVTVKAKQTAVNVHDSTIYVGDNWKAEDNFDSALDKDGNTVAFTKVTVDDSKVDTSKAGTYDVTYTYDGVTSTAKVTVKAKQKPTPKPDQPTDNGKTEKTTVDSKRNESKKDNSKMNMLPETGETSGVIFSLIGILILGLLSIALLFKNKVLKK